MFKLFAFAAGLGAGFQAWRNYPADGPASGDMLAVVFVAGLVAAYLGGRLHGRHTGGATAVAVASAESSSVAAAHNQVQVINVLPEGRHAGAGVRVPTETAPWMDGRPVLELDQLDGLEVSELLEERSTDVDGWSSR